MDITKFIVSGRDSALLYGDYSTYRAQLSRKLLAVRKRLGRTTKKGAKYTNKATVTAADIASNHEFIHLLLLTAERAWAHAMSMKVAHSTDTKGITGSTRSHIISRLHKARITVDNLIQSLSDRAITKATDTDLLEVRAYATSLSGAEDFEKQNWEPCVKSYSTAWIIYSALFSSTKSDIFKDLLSSSIEPSIRYAAYQMKLPRTVAIPVIARKYFASDDTETLELVEKISPGTLSDTSKIKRESAEVDAASRTITWRSRTVDLEDAAIAVALSSVTTALKTLTETLSSASTSRERASAYDDILIASQDAVDASKHAIDELVAEGVSQGDPRMQSLQITRTAISYDLISWRIGRNRVLTGDADGALPDSAPIARHKKTKNDVDATIEKEEGTGRKLAHLREKVALYDATLQSLDSIKELAGVARDTEFVQELDAKNAYFRALKCLAIARSHSYLGSHRNALALLSRASELLSQGLPILKSFPDPPSSSPKDLTISHSSADNLASILYGELQRHRGLVELSALNKSSNASSNNPSPPVVEKLNTYPSDGHVDLTNLVTYPPKLEPIPVKPLFFDVAYNYIQYPGKSQEREVPQAAAPREEKGKEQQPAKKGWFGFGRS